MRKNTYLSPAEHKARATYYKRMEEGQSLLSSLADTFAFLALIVAAVLLMSL